MRLPLFLPGRQVGHYDERSNDAISGRLGRCRWWRRGGCSGRQPKDSAPFLLNLAALLRTPVDGQVRIRKWLLLQFIIISAIFSPFFRFLLSGFELELYSTHEYSYFYWYLYELLFPWITTCLHRADTYLVEHEQMMESQQKQTGKTHFQEKCTKLFWAKKVSFLRCYFSQK